MLAELARLIALDEGSSQSFKVRAYENAIHGIEGYPGNVATLDQKELDAIKGVGGSIATRILRVYRYRKRRQARGASGEISRLPLVDLLKIPGLGPKTLKIIRAELEIENLDDLKAAIDRRGAAGAARASARPPKRRSPRSIERLGMHGKDRTDSHCRGHAGGRRHWRLSSPPSREWRPRSPRDLCDGLQRRSATSTSWLLPVKPEPVMKAVASHPPAKEVVGSGATKTSILTRRDCRSTSGWSPPSNSARPSSTSRARRHTTSLCASGPSTGAGCSTNTGSLTARNCWQPRSRS